MASKLSPGNALTSRAQKWKKDQGIISLTFDELLKKIQGKKFIAEQKVDGQSAIMEYRDGSSRFGSLGGRIITEIPVLNEIERILKDKKIHQALMVGELAGVVDGKIIHFDDTESLIKNPAKDKKALHWFPYQLLGLDGEEYGESFKDYIKGWAQIKTFFKSAKYVEPVEYEQGIAGIKGFWNRIVIKQKNEGLVVRTEDGKVYKSKPTFTYDLVVIAVGSKKGKNWPKKMIGNTLMAFMDEDRVFRVAGEIGTGWNTEEKKELFSWAQKNKVGEDDTYIWVKPQRIIEVQWERSNIKHNPAYKFEKGKYEKIEKRPVGTIVKPRFIRYRTDKSVTPKDLRLTQVPNWEKIKKMSCRIASNFFKRQEGLL
jgi:ATP-dependent DNA ligase